jgi:hypothetical protein
LTFDQDGNIVPVFYSQVSGPGPYFILGWVFQEIHINARTMYRSSENPFSNAARAVASLTKYGAHNLYEKIGDITQHLLDCETPEKDLVTGIPFVLVWKGHDSQHEIVSRNCSEAELKWLYRNVLPQDQLLLNIRKLLVHRRTAQRIRLRVTSHLGEGLDESFKIKSFIRGGTCLNFRLSQTLNKIGAQHLDLVVTVVLPMSNSRKLTRFQNDYEHEFLGTLEGELAFIRPASLQTADGRGSPVKYSLPETQSSFRFLQDTLEEVLGRITAPLSAERTRERENFAATFLFRTTSRRNEHDQQYRYVFTRSQIDELKNTRLSTIRVRNGNILDSFMNLPAIRRLSPKGQETVKRWLEYQEKERDLYDVLTNGHWYGYKSFVTYVSSLSPNQSMYISDWRIWYSPEEPWRTRKERAELKEWLAEDHEEFEPDSRTEPLDRLLRSEVEQYRFGLKSMFMVPLYGKRDEPPAAIVQISAAELSPEERVRDLQIIGFVYNEILGYLRADILQERLSERKEYDQFVDLAHLFTHAGTKLITTPMHNTLKRFDNAIKHGRFKRADAIDKWSIADGLFTTKTLETTLGILTRFELMDEPGGDGRARMRRLQHNDVNRSLMAQGIRWDQVELQLRSFSETAFFRHFWSVCHDPDHKEFGDYFAKGQIAPSEMIRVDFEPSTELPICLGHTDLAVMHLSNLVENAVEAFDLLKSALRWKKNVVLPLWHIDFRFTYEEKMLGKRREASLVLSVSNNSRPTKDETASLQKLDAVFHELSSRTSNAFLGAYRKEMRRREFTSKSGGSYGWALLEFASYLRRLEIRKGDALLQNGSIGVSRNEQTAVAFEIRFPVKINADESAHFLEYSEDETL